MSAGKFRTEIIGPDTVDTHLGQLLMPDGMKPHLKGQMEGRGLRLVAGFLGDRLVANGIWNPDSPTRADTLQHIPRGTPSISMIETREEFRGNGYASLVLEAICTALRERDYTHTYLVANPADTYERPGQEARSLDAFYAGREFEDWGLGPLPLVQHPADGTEVPEGATVNVYIRSLVPSLPARAILIPPFDAS